MLGKFRIILRIFQSWDCALPTSSIIRPGQSNNFTRYAPEKIPYVIKRYQDEGKRLLNTIDSHLAGVHDGKKKEYLVGDRYSIADIATWPWALISPWSGGE